MPRIVDKNVLDKLGGAEALDLAIANFQRALEAHKTTQEVPAPTAHPLVEDIVLRYSGQYSVAPEPEKPEDRRSKLEQNVIDDYARLRADMDLTIQRVTDLYTMVSKFQGDVAALSADAEDERVVREELSGIVRDLKDVVVGMDAAIKSVSSTMTLTR